MVRKMCRILSRFSPRVNQHAASCKLKLDTKRRLHSMGQKVWLLGGDNTLLIWSIVCVTMIKNVCQIFGGLGNSWREGMSHDQQMNSGSRGVEKSKENNSNIMLEQTHTPIDFKELILGRASPHHLFLSCCLTFELSHITSLSQPFSQNQSARHVSCR